MKNRSQGKKYEKVDPPFKKPNNDDDDAPRRYEKSEKHPDYKNKEQVEQYLSKGISPSPQNGQAVLDASIRIVPGVRTGIQNGYFIIFFRTRQLPEGGSIYHGFIETWDTFKERHKYKNKLVELGLIKENGKIL